MQGAFPTTCSLLHVWCAAVCVSACLPQEVEEEEEREGGGSGGGGRKRKAAEAAPVLQYRYEPEMEGGWVSKCMGLERICSLTFWLPGCC